MVILSTAAMLFYCIALALVTSRLFHTEGPNRSLVTAFAAVAVAIHGAILYQAIFTIEGQNYSITNVISTVSWMIALSVTITVSRIKVIVVVPVVFALAILSVALMWLLPPKYITHFEVHPEILTHVVLSLVSYSTMMLAALYAIQLSFIQKKLKQKQFMLSPAIPPLMTVERQLYHLIVIGMVFLSLSLATGFIFLDDMFGDGKGHKAVLSIVAWLMYLLMLWQHYRDGVKIRTAVIYTLTGSGLLTLAYFGARVVKEIILIQ